jgi:serine O-acetyltransferase
MENVNLETDRIIIGDYCVLGHNVRIINPKSDMLYRYEYQHKQLSGLRAIGFLLNHAVMCQILYRLQIFFYWNHMQWIAAFISSFNSLIMSVKIDSSTKIGGGLLILHANYIFIGKNVTMGERCILAHQNAIGPAFEIQQTAEQVDLTHLQQGPTIGDRVLFGVGATVSGNITIGSDSKIGINSAVEKSFPAYATLVGVPARNLNLSAITH